MSVLTEELCNKHIQLVNQVNGAVTQETKAYWAAYLDGWLAGTADCDISTSCLLKDADQYQISRGINSPMCGGVLLPVLDTKSKSLTNPESVYWQLLVTCVSWIHIPF